MEVPYGDVSTSPSLTNKRRGKSTDRAQHGTAGVRQLGRERERPCRQKSAEIMARWYRRGLPSTFGSHRVT